ncbi:MAG: hypothetical protein J7497_16505, partial [Chitinophagaceae bacterium]|nr:hypothetical protein [Chitinophagaceae bacterium]
MLLSLSRYHQLIAWFFVAIFYAELVLIPLSAKASVPTYAMNWPSASTKGERPDKPPINFSENNTNSYVEKQEDEQPENGPGQPEMQAFSSVNNANMVDLFSGDFSYNIPLLDVGGYPVNLSYRSGVSMDQESSWVGLGWNINPGTVNRNLRGLPDEFDGRYDSITKAVTIKENKTVGVTAGAGWELGGLPGGLSASLGLFHNNYKGWGLETGLNASINSGNGAKGPLAGGLSISNNTQEGLTIVPSLSNNINEQEALENSSLTGQFSVSLPYNSRSGMKGLQMSTGIRQYSCDATNLRYGNAGTGFDSYISFASPAFTPTISMPYTSTQISFTGKTGLLKKIFDANMFISGYVSKQEIKPADQIQQLPAYGYLNYQNAKGNPGALLDYNLEKDMPCREKPPV